MRAVIVVALVAIFAATAYADSCEQYCDILNANCAGNSTSGGNIFPFQSVAGCLKVCATYPTTGNTDDTTGNTLQCRIYHANVANRSVADAQAHCVHAGSSGGGQCGTTCDAYCNVMTYTTTTPNAESLLGRAPYADKTACYAYCSRFLNVGGQTNPGIATGNSAECREYHSSIAMQTGLVAHYTHALPESGTGACVRSDATTTYSTAVYNYCDLHLTYCGNTVDNATYAGAYYASQASCLKQASTLPRGWVSDGYLGNTSNSLDCRIYHAGVAKDVPSHCYHSGMNGVDQCGTHPCASYCQQIQATCTSTNAQYSSYANCYSQCLAMPGTSTAISGPYSTSGNTLSCRFYHIGVAGSATLAADIATHCTHAGPSGNGGCGYISNGYCNNMQLACAGNYTSLAACESFAATFPTTGTLGDATGNTMQCRLYHSGVATGGSAAAATHCPHAMPLGGADVTTGAQVGCGTACENYCNLVLYACNSTTLTGTKQYNSRTECEATCAAFPKGTVAGETTGDTLSCRSYHAGVAYAGDATTRTAHCPHAGPSGGDVCGTIVESVCDVAVSACGTAQFASRAACITALTAVSTGTFGDTAANTLQCRLYHGMVALNGDTAAKTLHCPHTLLASSACGSSDAGAASSVASASFAFVAAIVGAIAVL